MTDNKTKTARNRSGIKAFFVANSSLIITLAVVALSLWVFVPQLSNLHEALRATKQADKKLLTEAIVIFCLSFPIVAYKYYAIVPKKIGYWLTLKVQIASAFISKLLPMSIGSLTVNTYYLTVETGSVTMAASTMAFNAATSSVAFAAIVLVALLGNHSTVTQQASAPHDIHWPLIAFVVLILGVATWYLARTKHLMQRVKDSVGSLWGTFKDYKDHPGQIVAGVGLNAIGSLTGIATLYLCVKSVGLDPTFADIVLSYTMGNVVGSLVPTPGGLGGAEAGLYGGLVFLGYDSQLSLIAVLVYRLITYWLPLAPGYLMYRHLRHSTLADFHWKQKSAKS